MQIYNYHPTTGEFLHSSEARQDPLESTVETPVYLVPAHATSEALPEAQEGHVRVFGGAAWTQVEDHRGETVYAKADATAVVVDWLGEIGSDYTDQEPGEYPEWDGLAGEWISVPPDPQPRTVLSRLEFQMRLATNVSEQRTLDALADRVALPDGTPWPAEPTTAQITLSDGAYSIRESFRAAVEIDLESPLTTEALAVLVVGGVITEARRDELLTPIME